MKHYVIITNYKGLNFDLVGKCLLVCSVSSGSLRFSRKVLTPINLVVLHEPFAGPSGIFG